MVKELCDGVVAGQGVSVFSVPKLRRMMEEETLRLTAASKLNFALDVKLPSEDDFLPSVEVSKAQYKGILKVLQAAFQVKKPLTPSTRSQIQPDKRLSPGPGVDVVPAEQLRAGVSAVAAGDRAHALLGPPPRQRHAVGPRRALLHAQYSLAVDAGLALPSQIHLTFDDSRTSGSTVC